MPEGFWDEGFNNMTLVEKEQLYEYIVLVETGSSLVTGDYDSVESVDDCESCSVAEKQYLTRFIGRKKKAGESCSFPLPNCGKGLKCSLYVDDRYEVVPRPPRRPIYWTNSDYDGGSEYGPEVVPLPPGTVCVQVGISDGVPGFPVASLTKRDKCIPTGWPDVITMFGVHGLPSKVTCCGGIEYYSPSAKSFRCL